jgi:hypothetical protein
MFWRAFFFWANLPLMVCNQNKDTSARVDRMEMSSSIDIFSLASIYSFSSTCRSLVLELLMISLICFSYSAMDMGTFVLKDDSGLYLNVNDRGRDKVNHRIIVSS